MENLSRDLLAAWTRRRNDLIDFEIVPAMTPADFWNRTPADSDESPCGRPRSGSPVVE
jgi:hypothetical protein